MAVLPDNVSGIRLRGWLVMGSLVLLSACQYPSLRECRRISHDYIIRDGRVVLSETASILPTLDLELQFQIYNCSARQMHPSLRDLADPFAAQGQPAGVFLVDRILGQSDDAEVLSAVELLVVMKIEGTYDVTGNPETIMLIGDRAESIRSDGMRERALQQLQVLREG